MDTWIKTIEGALGLGAVAAPLAAGLSMILWSRLRARQAQAKTVKVRATRPR